MVGSSLGRTAARELGAGASGRHLTNNNFLLKKWYLDCVAENGDAAILYVAILQWRTLSLAYAGLLTISGDNVASDFSLRDTAEPESVAERIRLCLPSLHAEGSWIARRAPIRRTIYENEHGKVEWHCLQPMAEVDLLLRADVRIHGLGYAECLTLSLLPWHLPLSHLQWGRYLSDEDAMVWIDWQGPVPKRVIVHNGEERQADSIDESHLAFSSPDGRLELDRGLVLRHGRLGDTVLSKISLLAGLLPKKMLTVDECKWRSRATLRTTNAMSSGWAIHEVVQWNG